LDTKTSVSALAVSQLGKLCTVTVFLARHYIDIYSELLVDCFSDRGEVLWRLIKMLTVWIGHRTYYCGLRQDL